MVQSCILKSHSKMIEKYCYCLYSRMTGSKSLLALGQSMTPSFVVVSVLLPICCHIGWGMPYLCSFVEVTLLGAITDK